MRRADHYTCFTIGPAWTLSFVAGHTVASFEPAHVRCLSCPWIHPRLRRRIPRRGRRR